MNANDIIKAFECCSNNEKQQTCKYCEECPCALCELEDDEEDCYDALYGRGISLIKKQQAEIERLQKLLDDKCDRCIVKERAEAVREYAKTLVEKVIARTSYYLYMNKNEVVELIFDHTKERLGKENGNTEKDS